MPKKVFLETGKSVFQIRNLLPEYADISLEVDDVHGRQDRVSEYPHDDEDGIYLGFAQGRVAVLRALVVASVNALGADAEAIAADVVG